MAKLDAEERGEIPPRSLGLPGKRAYPMPDRAHAANAKARATQQYNAGNLSGSERAQIDRKAYAKLGDPPHPREHSLTMASAAHLANKGYISSAHHAAIRADAEKRLAVHKAKSPAASGAFGSLAPRGSVMDQDQDGY